MQQAGSARVARASSRRSRVGGHANGPEEKLSRSEVGGWRVTGDSESRDRGWGVVSRDIRDHERDAPPATGGGGTLGAHQGLSGPGGGAGAHRRRRCALETELAEARAKLRFTNIFCEFAKQNPVALRLFIRGDAGAARGRCRPRWRRGVGHRSRRWRAWCTDTQSWCISRRYSSRRSSRSALCVPRRFGNLSSCPPRPRTASPSLERIAPPDPFRFPVNASHRRRSTTCASTRGSCRSAPGTSRTPSPTTACSRRCSGPRRTRGG